MPVIELSPIKSVCIAQYYPDRNFANESDLFICRYKNAGDVYRTLLQFPFYRNQGQIGGDVILDQARLKLDIIQNDIHRGDIRVSVHQIWQAWLESNITWFTQPLFSVSPETSCTVKAGFNGCLEFDLTALVKNWQKGSLLNYGLLIAGDEEHNRLLSLAGKRPPPGRKAPRLELVYHNKTRIAPMQS